MSTAKSKYESWLFRTMNDPALSWTRPQSVRRKLVLAMIALAMAFACAMWFLPSIWWFAPLLVMFVPLMGSLNGATRGLTELRQHQLDERDGRTRDAAFRKVFWPMVVIAFAGVFTLSLTDLMPEQRVGIGFTTFLLVITMPTLFLAWTLPDDLSDED